MTSISDSCPCGARFTIEGSAPSMRHDEWLRVHAPCRSVALQPGDTLTAEIGHVDLTEPIRAAFDRFVTHGQTYTLVHLDGTETSIPNENVTWSAEHGWRIVTPLRTGGKIDESKVWIEESYYITDRDLAKALDRVFGHRPNDIA